MLLFLSVFLTESVSGEGGNALLPVLLPVQGS